MILLLYILVSIIDTKGFSKLENNGTKLFYALLMAVSCVLSIATGYIDDMPSPTDAIRNIILHMTGRGL